MITSFILGPRRGPPPGDVFRAVAPGLWLAGTIASAWVDGEWLRGTAVDAELSKRAGDRDGLATLVCGTIGRAALVASLADGSVLLLTTPSATSLYATEAEGGLKVFGTELDAVRAAGPPRLDQMEAVLRIVRSRHIAVTSLFQGILAIPGGSALTLDCRSGRDLRTVLAPSGGAPAPSAAEAVGIVPSAGTAAIETDRACAYLLELAVRHPWVDPVDAAVLMAGAAAAPGGTVTWAAGRAELFHAPVEGMLQRLLFAAPVVDGLAAGRLWARALARLAGGRASYCRAAHEYLIGQLLNPNGLPVVVTNKFDPRIGLLHAALDYVFFKHYLPILNGVAGEFDLYLPTTGAELHRLSRLILRLHAGARGEVRAAVEHLRPCTVAAPYLEGPAMLAALGRRPGMATALPGCPERRDVVLAQALARHPEMVRQAHSGALFDLVTDFEFQVELRTILKNSETAPEPFIRLALANAYVRSNL